ncbi:MAG TPA: carbohydrate kinase [Candidatus Fimicola cottocaccae]|nr:carbohydrate kinase [Candidatus Fimicola cottocaccae]
MAQNKKIDVAVLGEILIDFTYQGLSKNNQKLFAQNAGGAPANAAVVISKLGGKSAFIGKAGDDMHGHFLKNVLENENVNTEGFVIDDKYFTTLAFVDLNEKGERTFSFARKHSADIMLDKDDINMDIIENTQIFHVGSLSLTDEPSKGATYFAVEKAKENGATISYDPNYRSSLWKNEYEAKETMRSMIEYADVMKISDEETALLTDFAEPEKAGKFLVNKGVKIAVVTLGGDGACVCTKHGVKIVSGFKSNVVDTTGAGDSFWGGFLYKLSQSGKNPDEVTLDEACEFARFGNAVASICVEGFGAIPSMPSMEDVIKRMKM